MSTDKVDAREQWIATVKKFIEDIRRADWNSRSFSGREDDFRELANQRTSDLLAHLRTQPEGYVLVPVEPTLAMCEAGRDANPLQFSITSDSRLIYKAMIAAAQEGK